VADGITVAGLPVLRSSQVDATTLFWGIPKDHVMFVQRKGTSVERFPAVQNDGTWIRAISRPGLARSVVLQRVPPDRSRRLRHRS